MSVHEIGESFVNVSVTPLCPPAPATLDALTVTCASVHGADPPAPAEAAVALPPPTGDGTPVDAETRDEAGSCECEETAPGDDVEFCDAGEAFVADAEFDPPLHAPSAMATAPVMTAAATFVLALVPHARLRRPAS